MSIVIECQPRAKVGKSSSAFLRKQGKIPAIIYGKDISNVPISLEYRDIEKHRKHIKNHIIKLSVNSESFDVIIRNAPLHPVTDRILHMDFLVVNSGTPFTTEVELDFFNQDKCLAIKGGGYLNKVKRKLKVRVTPENLVPKISYDVQNTALGASIRLKDIQPAEGIELLQKDKNFTVATLKGKRVKAKASTESSTDKTSK